jgi:hypothetical protein
MKQDNSEHLTSETTAKMLAEYEQAQSTGHHSDAVFHEVAAVAWGANALLLGFILEVPCSSENQRLVIVAAAIGLLISGFVPLVLHLTKIGQAIAYSVCREIENELQLPHRLNNRIHDRYPPKRGQHAVWVITASFVLAWLSVIGNASYCTSRAKTVGTAAELGLPASLAVNQPSPKSSARWTMHLDYVNTGTQLLLLGGLVWYTLETRRIRRTSQKQVGLSRDQVEATLRPCVTLSTATRTPDDAILAVDGTDSTVIVRCPEGLAQIENIGVGPAINIRYELRPLNPQLTRAHPTGYVAGISKDGTFLIPVARALLVGHDFDCLFDYESVSHRKYRTKVTVKNLVITDLRFEQFPTENKQ